VWVRVVLGGVEETAWTDLASLRLPERHLTVAAEPSSRASAYATQEMSVARHPAGRRSRPADAEATTALSAVRDLSVVPDLSVKGGRRTADETAQFASVGRRRAPEVAERPSTGGRRRAPETDESPAVGRRRAPEGPPAATGVTGSSGRHRAPVDRGRHRTADTGLFPVVSDAAAAPATPRVAAARSSEPAARACAAWTAPEGLESELLTRPMRLSDHVPHARRPRLDGALRGV
jgi:hypothetical protein